VLSIGEAYAYIQSACRDRRDFQPKKPLKGAYVFFLEKLHPFSKIQIDRSFE
jgi:hypothetical protein